MSLEPVTQSEVQIRERKTNIICAYIESRKNPDERYLQSSGGDADMENRLGAQWGDGGGAN